TDGDVHRPEAGEGVAASHHPHPHGLWHEGGGGGEVVVGIVRKGARVRPPLENGLVVVEVGPGFQHESVLRARACAPPDHDPGLRPEIGVLDTDHAGDDLAVPGERLVHEIEGVGDVPDVAAGGINCVSPGPRIEGGAAGEADGADVLGQELADEVDLEDV